ncbi:hypothetical protein ILYODFUR_003181 [Ilyodon furcidens]|uniref:Uncharacterized protein n=1 Tax=Ilyodon furcidens TaxID=33524 RepID=A0ABV0V2H0_9TELE
MQKYKQNIGMSERRYAASLTDRQRADYNNKELGSNTAAFHLGKARIREQLRGFLPLPKKSIPTTTIKV